MKFRVPSAVKKAALEGLRLVEQGHAGDGLTLSAIQRARMLAQGKSLELTGDYSVKRMRDWFARHAVDYRPGWEDPPTPGYVAWMIWGGDPAKQFVDRMVERYLR